MARIGLDFDGVFADCNQLKRDVAHDMYGVDIPPEHYTKSYIFEHELLTEEEERTVREHAYSDREYGMAMEPVDDVFRYLTRLDEDGHDLCVITSRSGELVDIARDWYSQHRQQSEHDVPELSFNGVGYGNEKLDACLAENVDVFVDDDLHKLKPLQGEIPHRFHFVGEYGGSTETDVATPVHSWEELYNEIAAATN